MLPLLLVYFGEYTINLGVLPTILFSLPTHSSDSNTNPNPPTSSQNGHHPLLPLPSFIHSYRDFYPLYSTLYQLGVFLSRSSTPFPSLRLRHLYPPSLLQLLNLLLLLALALAPPSSLLPDDGLGLFVLLALVFWEGLLGGAVYVNTFAQIRERVPAEGGRREWALGAVSVSDSAGIAAAGVVSLGVEKGLCVWQVRRWGRDLCRML